MDNIEYFKSAWGDIKNSPGWFGKVCLLALVNLIPIFGQIVVLGYIYGWAREIAWGTHEPMPKKLMANEDGKFWRRGWFVFVLIFVFSLIPGIVYGIGGSIESAQVVMTFFGPYVTVDPFLEGLGTVLRIIGAVLMVLVGILAWVGSMRVSIYDRLSAGFQFGKIWKMMRHDSRGILRIFGMELLFSAIIGVVLSIVLVILATIVIMTGIAGLMNAGYNLQSLQYLTQFQMAQVFVQFVASAGATGIISFLIGSFLVSLAVVFIDLLVVRAVGYWTMQFEVPIWGGQDDPMPFELVSEEEEAEEFYQQDGPWKKQPVQPAPKPSVAEGRAAAKPVASAQASSEPAAAGYSYNPSAAQQPAPQPVQPIPPIPAPSDSMSGEFAAPAEGNPETSGAEAPGAEHASDMPQVTYEKTAVVGPEFVMSESELDEMREGAAEASGAHGAHGVEDGQAGDPDVGENGKPHIG